MGSALSGLVEPLSSQKVFHLAGFRTGGFVMSGDLYGLGADKLALNSRFAVLQ